MTTIISKSSLNINKLFEKMDSQLIYLADEPHHAQEIAKKLFSEFHYLLKGKTEKDVLEKMQKHCHRDIPPLTMILKKEDRLIGTVSLREKDLESHGHLPIWLASLYVVEEYRGQGIGRYLVHLAEKKAFELGHKKLYLFTPNKTAFYQKLGWEVLDTTQLQGHACDVMQKNIE